MPVAPPETNRTDIDLSATLAETGSIDATVSQKSYGQSAAELRRLCSTVEKSRVDKVIEAWVAYSAKEATLTRISTKDVFEKGQFGLDISFTAPSYAQVMQRHLLVFKPAILSRWAGFEIQTEKRINPVVLQSQCYHSRVHVKLPANFAIDELPDPQTFSTKFGKFAVDYKVTGDQLLFTEELDVSAVTLPAEQYGEAKDFFERVAGAEQAPLVLIKN
jgi:hypothetical protein